MRGIRAALRLWWISMVGLLGCTTAPDIRKPPKPPEELRVPPVSDLRFSQPPNLPKLPDEDLHKSIPPINPGGPAGASGMRGMGGSAMGGMGGMGGGMGGMGR